MLAQFMPSLWPSGLAQGLRRITEGTLVLAYLGPYLFGDRSGQTKLLIEALPDDK